MKKGLIFLVGIIFLITMVYSCKKIASFDEQGNLLADSEFNAANLKTWFYKTFQNSPDALQLVSTDKKYPVWNNGIYYKFSNYEVFEFPLIKNKKEFHIPSNLPQVDRKRIAENSLDRIRFIKNKEGKISVIEVNYIPEIQYLQSRNYDISNTAMGKENSDFTGRMILKKWNGELLNKYIFKNGKATGKIKMKKNADISKESNTNTSNLVNCEPGQQTLCMMYQWCMVEPDGLVHSCGEWEIDWNSCWCEGEPTDPCEGSTDENCGCEQVGDCGGGVGGGDDPDLGTDSSVQKTFKIHHENGGGGYDVWDLFAFAQLQGVKFVDANMNTFTSITANQSPVIECQIGQCLTFLPSSPAYGLIHSHVSTNNLLDNDTKGHSNQTVVLYYPNTSQYRSLSNYYTWNAASDL